MNISMKAKYILSSAILSGVLATSCVDLDTAPMSAYVTTDQKSEIYASDPTKAEAGVNGVFAQYSAYMAVTGSRHNDFGYPSIMLFTDTNGMDYVVRITVITGLAVAWNSQTVSILLAIVR